jgi:hypothetical protein
VPNNRSVRDAALHGIVEGFNDGCSLTPKPADPEMNIDI